MDKKQEIAKTAQVKRALQGTVRKVIDECSVTVVVEKVFPNPLYKRLMKKKKTYLVNVPKGMAVSAGAVVSIKECRPMSKSKRWIIVSEQKKE